MDAQKDLLIKSAAGLYSLGVDWEMARKDLRKLVEQGVSYHSREMREHIRDFRKLIGHERKWKSST